MRHLPLIISVIALLVAVAGFFRQPEARDQESQQAQMEDRAVELRLMIHDLEVKMTEQDVRLERAQALEQRVMALEKRKK